MPTETVVGVAWRKIALSIGMPASSQSAKRSLPTLLTRNGCMPRPWKASAALPAEPPTRSS